MNSVDREYRSAERLRLSSRHSGKRKTVGRSLDSVASNFSARETDVGVATSSSSLVGSEPTEVAGPAPLLL